MRAPFFMACAFIGAFPLVHSLLQVSQANKRNEESYVYEA
jgi:hypothetical protein